MVLQRERAAAIWGEAAANAEVSVSFKSKTASARADDKGHWRAAIETGAADARGKQYVNCLAFVQLRIVSPKPQNPMQLK